MMMVSRWGAGRSARGMEAHVHVKHLGVFEEDHLLRIGLPKPSLSHIWPEYKTGKTSTITLLSLSRKSRADLSMSITLVSRSIIMELMYIHGPIWICKYSNIQIRFDLYIFKIRTQALVTVGPLGQIDTKRMSAWRNKPEALRANYPLQWSIQERRKWSVGAGPASDWLHPTKPFGSAAGPPF